MGREHNLLRWTWVEGIADGYRDTGPTGLGTTDARLVSDRWRIRDAHRS